MSRKILFCFLFMSIMSLHLSGGLSLGEEDVNERITQLKSEATELYRAKKYTEALIPAGRVLELSEKAFGPEHPWVATALNNLATLYLATGAYAQAEPLYRRALAIREQALGPEHPDVAQSLNNLATLYKATVAYTQAIPLSRRALAIQEQALGPEHPGVARALNNLAELYRASGDYAQAEPLYQRALVIFQQALGPEHSSVAIALNNLAELYRASGDYAQAEPLYQRALVILEEALGPKHPHMATALHNLAELYHATSDYAQAEQLYRRALAIRGQALGPDHPNVGLTLNNLAELYRALGDYGQAEPLSRRALLIWEKAFGPEHPQFAVALNNLATLYLATGDYAQAEPLYQRVLVIWEQALGPEHSSVAIALNNLALLYRTLGDYAQAEPLYRRSLAIREQAHGPKHPRVATALNNLATLYLATGAYAQAEPLYQRVLTIDEQALGPEHPDVATDLNNLAELYRATGAYAQAEPLYRRSLAIMEQALGPEHPNVALALYNLGLLVASQKKYPTALGLFQRGLRIQSRQLHNIFSFTTERQKLAFLHTILGEYEAYLSLIYQQFMTDPKAVNQGLALVLQRKGVVLDAQSRIRTAMKGRLSEAAQKNWERLSALQSQQSQLVLNRPKDLTLEVYRQQLETLQTEIQMLEQTLARESALVAKDLKQGTITVDAVARAVPKGAVLVEFAKIQDFDFAKGQWQPTSRYLAFVRTKAGTVTLVDLGEAEALEAQVAQALAAIRSSLRSLQKKSIQDSLEALTTLSDRVWTPLIPTLGDATQLLLSPDGQLNLVPFGALRDAEGRFMVEQYQITYLSSGRDLIGAGEGVTAPSRELLLVANPTYGATLSVGTKTERAVRSADVSLKFSDLPGTKQEAQTIPPLVPGSTQEGVLVGKAARESVVKAARSPRILHLATHGFFLADRPLGVGDAQRGLIRGGDQFGSGAAVPENYENPLIRSGLAFAGANHAAEHTTGEDGLLTALEITGMDLSGTELVVLSACDTALGKIQTGEGVFGLRRAFSLAGAQNLLMSLWPVSDAITAQQMRTFYTNLQTQSPAQALRNAQRATIKKLRAAYKGLAPPALWAPFILQGAPVAVK